MKNCYKCTKDKNTSEFGKHKGKQDGLQPLCKQCVKDYRKDNKDKFAQYDKEKYEKHGEKIRDRQKNARKLDPEKFSLRNKLYRENNYEYLKEYDAEKNRNFKIEVFSHYGSECECCGEQFMELLTIDHVKGGGTSHRKEVGFGLNFYRWLKDNNFPKEGFRVLCMNCNHSYGVRGYCPHKDGTKFKSVRD